MNSRILISNIFVAVAYYIAAQAGLLLAVPPSNAAAVWPAAGIATVAVIILGPRILPGIFLASLLIHGKIIFDATGADEIILSLLMAVIGSAGRVVQTWLAARLVKPVLAQDQALLREHSIVMFCLLAGPVSCIISATAGVSTLWFQGILNPVDLPLAWATWWIGDSIGVLVVCPLVLCFVGKPRRCWRPRIYSVAMPLGILILVVFAAFNFSYQQELKYIEGEFEKNTLRFKSELVDSIDIHIWSSEDLKAHIDPVGMSAEEFFRYVKPKLSRHTEIKALEWIPVIRHVDRQAFEKRIGRPIKIRNQSGEMERAPDKDFYYPIEYLEPLTGNENALGFDVRTNPIAAAATEQACASGKLAATGPIELVQEATTQIAVVFYNPVYRLNNQGDSDSDCEQLFGFATSVFRLENAIRDIHKNLPDSHVLVSLRNESELFYSDGLDADEWTIAADLSKFKRRYEISVAGQQWQISFLPVSEFVSIYASWSMWITIVGGLLFSAMFGIGLLMLTGRNFLTEEKIDQRTIELNKEVKRRKEIAALLEVEKNCLEMITQDFSTPHVLDSITTGINKIIPDTHASILLLSADGRHLEHGSAPSLPAEYIEAIDGVEIGPSVGSCGTAAFLNQQVIVGDIANDPLWENYKEYALKHDLKACWSTPITVSGGKVLGTFALYFKTPKEPDSASIDLIRRMVNIAAIVILRRQSEERLIFHATHDTLTELVNRREFERRALRLLESVKQDKREHALCFMDLDQFKVVNDSCGHAAGDEMLRQITTVLQKVVRKRDTLARMGGDEFSVLMEHCSLEQAQRLAVELHQVIQDYVFVWEEQSFRVGVSIGLVAITEAVPNLAELLKEADAACYMAKDSGRNRIHVYHPEDAEIAQRHGEMQWVSKLNQALAEDRFCLYAQTIVPLNNSKQKHYELLIRMIDENQQIVPPGAFLPAAERYNVASKIDLWVIEQAFRLLSDNPAFVEQVSFISINLSGQSLADQNILNFIKGQLAATSIDGNKICFEITETAAISNLAMATKLISELKQEGCRFALDDFGSGLSSFGYLKSLSVDYLKIDGMFVKDIVDDPIDHAMVKSINEIGQVMGMRTIAEFVENDEIKGMLREIGVNYAQGYGVGKPMPFSDLLESFE